MRHANGQVGETGGACGGGSGAFRPLSKAVRAGIGPVVFRSGLVRGACAVVAILAALLLLGLWLMRPTLHVDIAPEHIRPVAGLPYAVPVPQAEFPYAVRGDGARSLRRSTLVLYEDGARLGPAHAPHRHIRDVGRGAYSQWGRILIFSSSDNTDPRTNGRRYSFDVTAEPAPGLAWFARAVLLAASAGLVLAYADALRTGARAVRRVYARRPHLWTAVIMAISVAAFAVLAAFELIAPTLVVIGLGGVAVATVQLLPLPVRSPRLLAGIALALVGFLAFHLAVRAVEQASGLAPEYLLAPYVRNALERASAGAAKPAVLLVGSSHSELGIDEEVLEQALREQGHDVTVLRLVAGGSGMTEQWYQTRRFLEFATVKPVLVLFEASGAYHAYGPFFALRENPLSNRAIATTDAENAYWALRWLVQADWHLTFSGVSRTFGLSERLALGLRLLGHFALREARIGYATGASVFGRIEPVPNLVYSAKVVSIPQAAFNAVLSHGRDDEPPHLSAGLRGWVQDFNRHQVETLEESGVRRIGFYSVPTVFDREMQYLHYFCRHMAEQPCLDSADPGLLKALAEDRHWRDGEHLLGDGRIIYTRWLARQIAARQGLLP